MQTFLPYACFRCSAAALDPARLGKQRVEAYQILRALSIPGYGWQRHPAVLMWKDHRDALVTYGVTVSRVWRLRGYRDTCLAKIAGHSTTGDVFTQAELEAYGLAPPWLGDEALHRSHRSALVRKDPVRYAGLFPGVPDDLPYEWPA